MFQIRDLMVDVLPGDAMRLFPCTCRVSADEREGPGGDPQPPPRPVPPRPQDPDPMPVPDCLDSVLPSADCVPEPDREARRAADLSLLRALLKRQLRGDLERRL